MIESVASSKSRALLKGKLHGILWILWIRSSPLVDFPEPSLSSVVEQIVDMVISRSLNAMTWATGVTPPILNVRYVSGIAFHTIRILLCFFLLDPVIYSSIVDASIAMKPMYIVFSGFPLSIAFVEEVADFPDEKIDQECSEKPLWLISLLMPFHYCTRTLLIIAALC